MLEKKENRCLFGLPENILAAISYVGIFVTGILVFIFERENKFVRFHALQSTILFAGFTVLEWILSIVRIIPLIGNLILSIYGLFVLVTYIYLIYTAYRGILFKVPILGDVVWEQVNK